MGSAVIMDIVIFCILYFSEKIPRIQKLGDRTIIHNMELN